MPKPVKSKRRNDDYLDDDNVSEPIKASDIVFDAKVLLELERGIQIDKDALEESLLEQPNNFYHVSMKLSLWTSRRDAAKQEQQLIEARADAAIRHNAEVAKEKITEKEVESQKRMDEDVRTGLDELLRYNHTVNRFANLKEAYQQRGYVLKELVALYLANYYATNNVSSSPRDRAAEAGKREAHESRQRMTKWP